jgi:hypothetical protein
MKLGDFKKVPISEAIKIPSVGGHYDLVKDMWWGVTDDECILYYRGYSRQCNRNKSITESIINSDTHPATKVIFLESVWEKHDCKDYE